mmetsp:Transcript_38116/g.96382  ORF Transcript_38116/g.96382 Transcript_38116/m.96382 type:complete len:282 (-) Transcript_38116:1342-2187(-)
MRLATWHSMCALASLSRGAPENSPLLNSSPARRSSPGAKGRASCRMTLRSPPSGTMEMAKRLPTCSSGSMARSFFTATVRPGGSKLAWDTQLASMAVEASSLVAVSTDKEPTRRPAASCGPDADAAARTPGAAAASLALAFFLTDSARSRPLSSHTSTSLAVGLNLTRMEGKENLKPASFSRPSISSTASPLHPKLPNTPQGRPLADCSRMMVPSATDTWVGMWPPRVGEPRMKPSELRTAAATSSRLTSSRLYISTPTPALVTPRAMACASAVVLPYADA